MKKIVIMAALLLVFSVIAASAGPFLYTEPTTEAVTSYTVIIDGNSEVVTPTKNNDGTVMMVKDLGTMNLSNGAHSGTVEAWNTLWGIKTNTVPFNFSKPAQLTDPVIGLSQTNPSYP